MSRSKHVFALFLVAIISCTGLIAPASKSATSIKKRLSITQSFYLPESSQTEGGAAGNKLKMKKGLSSLLLAASLAFGAPAVVAAAVGGAPSVFTNDYNDPLHPLCGRHVQVSSDGKAFHYSGTAVGPKGDSVIRGCTRDEIKEFGLRSGAFDGFIDGTKISAGDGIHEGVWEPANSVTTNLGYEDVDGVRWNDGNKWTVKQKPLSTKIGEVIFLAYIGVSTLAGVKAVADKVRNQQ
jgi:hypothetical protein